jgi:uncharacterized Zn finger protein
MSEELYVRCIGCGAMVTLTQPDDHREYAPSARCANCGRFYYAHEKNGELQVSSMKSDGKTAPLVEPESLRNDNR